MFEMTLTFEFFTCTIVDAVASATKHNSQEEAWARFCQDVGDSPTFAAVYYLDLSSLSKVHPFVSFQRHVDGLDSEQLQNLARASVETLRDLTAAPERFKLGTFWEVYGERVKRISESEFPFVNGAVFPPAHLSPGMILQEEEMWMRRARLGVPAGPGQRLWLICGDGSMATTGRCRLIPYSRILREPEVAQPLSGEPR